MFIDGEPVEFSLHESIRRVVHVTTAAERAKPLFSLLGPKAFDYLPTGDFTLLLSSYGCNKRLAHRHTARLESRLDEIIAIAGDLAKRARDERSRMLEREATRRAAEVRIRAKAEEQRQAFALCVPRTPSVID